MHYLIIDRMGLFSKFKKKKGGGGIYSLIMIYFFLQVTPSFQCSILKNLKDARKNNKTQFDGLGQESPECLNNKMEWSDGW